MLPLMAVLLLWPAIARAVDLTDFKTDDQDKKLRLEFNFSESVEAQVVNNYASNFVDIGISGLKVPRDLARQDHTPDNEETANFYRFTRFVEVDKEQHIRIYLGKYANPSDVQVVPLDSQIAVEMVKPYWKLPPEEAAAGESEGEAGFIPDEASTEGAESSEAEESSSTDNAEEPESSSGAWNTAAGSLANDSGEDTGSAETESGQSTESANANEGEEGTAESSSDTEEEAGNGQGQGEEQPNDNGLDAGEEYGQTSLRDLSSEGEQAEGTAETANGAAMQPVRSLTKTPSYKQFDLDDVPVAQVQLRNMPFNEALMQLVAGTGFNVIVGDDVSDEVMTLDFRQKELSLKRALDLLCMAYDLAYVVEDDAIIVNHK